jgi:hypothetical protein
MTWVYLAGDLLIGGMGVSLLLMAYRVIGKPIGADEQYDAGMARQAPTYKILGWCGVIMATLGLMGGFLGIGF